MLPISSQASDVMSLFRDTFQEELTRSRATKLSLAALIPQALENIEQILQEPMNDKNRAVKAQTAQWLLDANMIDAELPKLQLSLIKSERESRTLTEHHIDFTPVRLSPTQLAEFMREALEVDNEIRLLKAKQALQLEAP